MNARYGNLETLTCSDSSSIPCTAGRDGHFGAAASQPAQHQNRRQTQCQGQRNVEGQSAVVQVVQRAFNPCSSEIGWNGRQKQQRDET